MFKLLGLVVPILALDTARRAHDGVQLSEAAKSAIIRMEDPTIFQKVWADAEKDARKRYRRAVAKRAHGGSYRAPVIQNDIDEEN